MSRAVSIGTGLASACIVKHVCSPIRTSSWIRSGGSSESISSSVSIPRQWARIVPLSAEPSIRYRMRWSSFTSLTSSFAIFPNRDS